MVHHEHLVLRQSIFDGSRKVIKQSASGANSPGGVRASEVDLLQRNATQSLTPAPPSACQTRREDVHRSKVHFGVTIQPGAKVVLANRYSRAVVGVNSAPPSPRVLLPLLSPILLLSRENYKPRGYSNSAPLLRLAEMTLLRKLAVN